MKRILILIFLLFFPVFTLQAQQISEKEAKDWVNAKGSEILRVIVSDDDNKYQKLDEIMLNDVDIPYIAKFVMGKYWKIMTDEQKETFSDMFQKYMLAVYRKFPLEFKEEDIKFSINRVKSSKNFVDVIVPLRMEGAIMESTKRDSIDISFRIHRNNGKLQLIDLGIGESSLLKTYRNKVYELMQQDQEEVEWFLEDFEKWIPAIPKGDGVIEEELNDDEPLLVIENQSY